MYKMKFNTIEGGLYLNRVINVGSTGKIWKATLKRNGVLKNVVVKRISKLKNEIYAKFNWKGAGMLVPPLKTKACLNRCYLDLKNSDLSVGECNIKVTKAKSQWNKDKATSLLLKTNYGTEVSIGKLLRKKVSPKMPTPVFCKVFSNFTSKNHHNIVMENAGFELQKFWYLLTLEEFQSIIMQVIIALHWSQKLVCFKHHDLHCGNIYFKKNKVNKIWRTSNKKICLPDNNFEAVISDFGLSIANNKEQRIARLDFELLNTKHSDWGEWNYDLENNEGYDVLVMIESLRDECTGSKLEWLNKIYEEIDKIVPLKISKIGRPQSQVPITPEKILELNCFQLHK